MRTKQYKLTVAVALSLGATALMLAPQSSDAGITDSKHNLGSTASADNRNNTVTDTNEICVFCHTPHGSNTDASVPLWNKNLPTSGAASYSTYADLGSSTLDGAILEVGSVSIACLSCHDGTQAVDNIINGPGSGDYVLDGSIAGRTGRGWDWTAQSGTVNLINTATADKGQFAPGVIANIGTDLTNDHPIGIAYAGGPVAASITGATYGSAKSEFQDVEFNTLANNANATGPRWWVNVTCTGCGNRAELDKTDMVMFTRTPGGTGDVVDLAGPASPNVSPHPFVECATCHDPHTSVTTFLRIPGGNTASTVCLACHTK